MMPTLRIQAKDVGERLDVLLARAYPDYSRSFMQKLVRQGGVTREGARLAPSYRVRAGESLEVVDFTEGVRGETEQTEHEQGSALASGIAPHVLFEDKVILVIDKPAGLVVHPAPSFSGSTLIDWLRRHLGGQVAKIFTDPERLGLVHRLDKDTSGVLVIAKSIPAQIALARQFRDRIVRKTYAAFVEGVPEAPRGIITAPVGRSRKQPYRMAVSSSGRPSETAFEVKETFQEVSHVVLYPKTGRTHQIRVHLAAIGHPIVGDQSYGAKTLWRDSYGVQRPLLHAERLELEHPVTKRPVAFDAPWPADFREARRRFRALGKTVGIFLIAAACTSWSRAEQSAASPSGTTSHRTHRTATAASGTSSTASALRSIRKDIAALQSDLEAMKKQLEDIQNQLDETGAPKRLHDLERSVSEINAKAVATSNTAEEAKTQTLEAARKLKTLQDTLDQLRDQMDRLQSQAIEHRAREEAEPAPESQKAP